MGVPRGPLLLDPGVALRAVEVVGAVDRVGVEGRSLRSLARALGWLSHAEKSSADAAGRRR